MKKNILVLMLLVLLTGCKTGSRQVREIQLTERTVVRDSLVSVAVPADSGLLVLELEADTITHKPIIKVAKVEATQAMSLDYTIKDKRLEVHAKTKPPNVQVKHKSIVVYKPYPVMSPPEIQIVNKLHSYQKVLMYAGFAALLYLLIRLIIKLKIK